MPIILNQRQFKMMKKVNAQILKTQNRTKRQNRTIIITVIIEMVKCKKVYQVNEPRKPLLRNLRSATNRIKQLQKKRCEKHHERLAIKKFGYEILHADQR